MVTCDLSPINPNSKGIFNVEYHGDIGVGMSC